MKKIVLFGLVCTMGVSTANAGWFGDLFKKSAEPQTLTEACNTDEIASICPEIALGQKTLTECLSENVKSLSKKCAKYVKKSIADKKAANEKSRAESKKALDEKKAAVKATGKEIKDAATAVKNDAVATGKSFKEIVK